ncbi:MAG: hypothetical protein RR984_00300 [Bacilli bacterium]
MSMPIIISSNIKRCQAITDVIESVALQETGLSHIINAEGEKIQKALELSKTNEELLKVNDSVQSMVKSITILESILQDKLNVCLSKDCPDTPCVKPVVEATLEDKSTGTLVLTEPELYTFTGNKKVAKIKITSSPVATVTNINPLPVGVTLVNNTITFTETYVSTVENTLNFNIGDAPCNTLLKIIAKAVA